MVKFFLIIHDWETPFYKNKIELICIMVWKFVWISSTKCKGILSFSEALSQRNNKNVKLSILFLAPKFHSETIIFKQDNILQKHLISWHDLILQPPCQANFVAVYLTFMCNVLNVLYFSLILFCVTVKCSSVNNSQKYFYQCLSKFLQDRMWMLLIFMVQCCFVAQFYL